MVGCYEHDNEPYCSIKGGEFLDWLCILSAAQEERWCMEFVSGEKKYFFFSPYAIVVLVPEDLTQGDIYKANAIYN